jgi:X-X-X-Leu-X-X-Gly heptad repeat protein
VRIGAIVVLAWLAGFTWFALTLPVAVPLAVTTDAVVVLTGGAGRLARGVATLEAGSAQRMLVSGVGEHVGERIGKPALAALVGAPLKLFNARVDLGYAAVDTRSNAIETTAWTQRHGYGSLRLVTSAAHMRRARLELAAQMPPKVRIVEDAVPTEPWTDSIAREYSKYLLRLAALSAGAT